MSKCVICGKDVSTDDKAVGFKWNGKPRFYTCAPHAQVVRESAETAKEAARSVGRAAFAAARDALLARIFPT